MKGSFLMGSHDAFIEHNIFADKSSLVLEWLLLIGIKKTQFSIREIARDRNISVGLVQKVFETLVMNGYLQFTGIRTAKKFILKNPMKLLKSWIEHYSIVKKCKMHTYQTGLQSPEQILNMLKKSHLNSNVALALHSAAEGFGIKNTNLQIVELYLLNPEMVSVHGVKKWLLLSAFADSNSHFFTP